MKKKINISVIIVILLFLSPTVKGQMNIGSEGLSIGTGTVFYSEGLTLIPANDWKTNNLTISREALVVMWPKFNSIRLIYRFSRPVPFTGELGFNLKDLDLNSDEEKDLVLAYSSTNSNNYVDFNLVNESVFNHTEMYLNKQFSNTTIFSDITAVKTESTLTPYQELIANNMITPNGDGVNDTWVIKNILHYPNNELDIFDREGRMVFTMIGYDNLWKGDFNDSPLPEGTYYYILYIDSGKAKKTGFISIVK